MRAYVTKKSSTWPLDVLVNNNIQGFINFLHTILRDVYVERYGRKNDKYYIQINAGELSDVVDRYVHDDPKAVELIDNYFSSLAIFQNSNSALNSKAYKLSYLNSILKSKMIDFNNKINIYWE